LSLSPSAIRQRVETALVAALGALVPVGRKSSTTYDRFPMGDALDRTSHSFAVGLPRSASLPVRQLQAAGQIPTESSLGVRWTWLVKVDDQVASYDAALDRELVIVNAVLDTVGNRGPAPVWLSADRKIIGDGTFLLGELLFTVFHGYPVTP
jgi:hypothetical protein